MIQVKKNIDVVVKFTPEELASIFADMDSYAQARFFNQLARDVAKWDRGFEFQLQAIIDAASCDGHLMLDDEALELFSKFGRYSTRLINQI